jgi:hypothetical protein
MKHLKPIQLVPAMIAAALLGPNIASADFVLDTGTPTGTTSYELDGSQLIAAEFVANGGDEITTVSAYLNAGGDQSGTPFTFEIFSAAGTNTFLGNRSPVEVASVAGTFTTNGWTTSTLNWTPSATGDYWIALVVPSSRTAPDLVAPAEASATTGTVPALGFATAGSATAAFAASTAYIGLEVSEAAPVPLPAAVWLLGSGLVGLGSMMRRRRVAARIASPG